MGKLFEILFLEEAFAFLKSLNQKHYEKILYNIRKAQIGPDAELFKKLNNDIWEFRTLISRSSIPALGILGQNYDFGNFGDFDTWFHQKAEQSP